MHRPIVYPGAQPLETDLLNATRHAMVGLGVALQAILGPGPYVDGLACTPGSGLAVQVGPGSIYVLQSVDATAFSSLAANTTDQIIKQGLFFGTATFNTPAPATAGQSIVYLIEAQYQDVDGVPTSLPYYNASNPSAPVFNSAPSIRQSVCALQIKAGTAAATGSQVAPAADGGWTALYTVTVANGASSIAAGNIATVTGAPFLSLKLPQTIGAPTVQSNQLTYGPDTGTANTYQVAYSPAITKLSDGMALEFQAATGNNGASTFTPNPGVIAPAPLIGGAHQALQGGEIAAAGKVSVMWHQGLASWILQMSTGGTAQVGAAQQSNQAVNLAQTKKLINSGLMFYLAQS